MAGKLENGLENLFKVLILYIGVSKLIQSLNKSSARSTQQPMHALYYTVQLQPMCTKISCVKYVGIVCICRFWYKLGVADSWSSWY